MKSTRSHSLKRCVIYFYEGWYNVSPTLKELTACLRSRGFQVSIYCGDTNVTQCDDVGRVQEVISIRQDRGCLIHNLILRVSDYFHLIHLRKLLQLISFASKVLLAEIISYGLWSKPVFIGIDTNGSIAAFLHSFLLRPRSIVYLSLELADRFTFYGIDRARRILERMAFSRSNAIIVQDSSRLSILETYLGSHGCIAFTIPNSSSKTQDDCQTSSLLHDLVGIKRHDICATILSAGMISDHVYSKELAMAFLGLGSEFALVFHERTKRTLCDPYIQELLSLNSINLHLSLNPVPYEDIDLIFRSADIGVATYRPIDENFSEISKASGKLSFYLKHGKPVLLSNLESLRLLNERYRFGVVLPDISSASDIRKAISEILSDYDGYSKRALHCFEQEFEFTAMAEPFLHYLDSLY